MFRISQSRAAAGWSLTAQKKKLPGGPPPPAPQPTTAASPKKDSKPAILLSPAARHRKELFTTFRHHDTLTQHLVTSPFMQGRVLSAFQQNRLDAYLEAYDEDLWLAKQPDVDQCTRLLRAHAHHLHFKGRQQMAYVDRITNHLDPHLKALIERLAEEGAYDVHTQASTPSRRVYMKNAKTPVHKFIARPNSGFELRQQGFAVMISQWDEMVHYLFRRTAPMADNPAGFPYFTDARISRGELHVRAAFSFALDIGLKDVSHQLAVNLNPSDFQLREGFISETRFAQLNTMIELRTDIYSAGRRTVTAALFYAVDRTVEKCTRPVPRQQEVLDMEARMTFVPLAIDALQERGMFLKEDLRVHAPRVVAALEMEMDRDPTVRQMVAWNEDWSKAFFSPKNLDSTVLADVATLP